MMFVISIASVLLLSPAVLARPRVMPKDEPLSGKSRITAFVLNSEGEPSVECWELSGTSESMKTQRADGSSAMSHAFSLTRDNQLDGVEILTWPSISDIWPPSSDDSVRTANFDLSGTFNLFNVQGGLINFGFSVHGAKASSAADPDFENHIFSLENGDDWFYFEDEYTPSTASKGKAATADSYPFDIRTVSGTETEVMRLRYNSQPKHTLLHKDACKFTGIDTSEGQKSSQTDSGQAGLTVQVNVGDL